MLKKNVDLYFDIRLIDWCLMSTLVVFELYRGIFCTNNSTKPVSFQMRTSDIWFKKL